MTVNLLLSSELESRLRLEASRRGETVDELAIRLLDIHLPNGSTLLNEKSPTVAERLRLFEEWQEAVAKRGAETPEGYHADDSRETIYEDR